MEFAGKRVLITGSSRGIGQALARRFITDGANVAINGRSAAAVAQSIEALGGSAQLHSACGDVSTAAGCESVVKMALESLGGLDILINNTGTYPIASIEDTDEALWDTTLNANVKSAFFCSRAALPALRASKGVIINHSSIAGLMGFANISVYCTSKAAVANLTRSMAMELAPDVRVNCVCPTTVDNDMGWQGFNRAADPQAAYDAFAAGSKMKRLPTNDDVVEAFAFLASDRASFMTGVALPVDGGKSAGA
ncbi:MAG: meso-butanediol dehydrogenase/(S,S)-butanediol dehydrogenase/diacetyl reductase [Gammaproteobacteria bacterium]|jgi:meso-butanediol dehydrogenase/(S,S)-butanediol dehydrogenase/diacetyl reductase